MCVVNVRSFKAFCLVLRLVFALLALLIDVYWNSQNGFLVNLNRPVVSLMLGIHMVEHRVIVGFDSA